MMRIKPKNVWPKSVNLHIDLHGEEGLGERWSEKFYSDLSSVLILAGIDTPEQMYQDALKAASRWLSYELTMLRRAGEREPTLRAFTVTYFAEKDTRGKTLAVIDVLSGRISR